MEVSTLASSFPPMTETPRSIDAMAGRSSTSVSVLGVTGGAKGSGGAIVYIPLSAGVFDTRIRIPGLKPSATQLPLSVRVMVAGAPVAGLARVKVRVVGGRGGTL